MGLRKGLSGNLTPVLTLENHENTGMGRARKKKRVIPIKWKMRAKVQAKKN